MVSDPVLDQTNLVSTNPVRLLFCPLGNLQSSYDVTLIKLLFVRTTTDLVLKFYTHRAKQNRKTKEKEIVCLL